MMQVSLAKKTVPVDSMYQSDRPYFTGVVPSSTDTMPKAYQPNVLTIENSSAVLFTSLRDKLAAFENISTSAIKGDACLVSVMSAVQEAKLCIELLTQLRNQLVSCLDKLVNFH